MGPNYFIGVLTGAFAVIAIILFISQVEKFKQDIIMACQPQNAVYRR